MTTKANVLIIHGTGGSPEENWFTWLANSLKADGHDVAVPKFPTPEGQSLESWTRTFAALDRPLDSRSIVAAHSLAPAFVLSLLEKAQEPIWGAFLVAGFIGNLGLEEFDSLNHTFTCREFDWDRIRKNSGTVHLYNSDDDPYVPLSKGEELAEKLNAKLHIVRGGGHQNSEAGYSSYPALLEDIRKFVRGGLATDEN